MVDESLETETGSDVKLPLRSLQSLQRDPSQYLYISLLFLPRAKTSILFCPLEEAQGAEVKNPPKSSH